MKHNTLYVFFCLMFVHTASPAQMFKTRGSQDEKTSYRPSFEHTSTPQYKPATYTAPAVASLPAQQAVTGQRSQAAQAQKATSVSKPGGAQNIPAPSASGTDQAARQQGGSDDSFGPSTDSDINHLQFYISKAQEHLRRDREQQLALEKRLDAVQNSGISSSDAITKLFSSLVAELTPVHQDIAQKNDLAHALMLKKALDRREKQYLQEKKKLSAGQTLSACPNESELKAHFDYLKNEQVGSKIKAARTVNNALIQDEAQEFLDSPEGRRFADNPSHKTLNELRTDAHSAFEKLENLKNEKAQLQGRINSWFYRLKFWELPKKELEKLDKECDQKIEQQDAIAQNSLLESYAVEHRKDITPSPSPTPVPSSKSSKSPRLPLTPPDSPRSPESPRSPRSPSPSKSLPEDYRMPHRIPQDLYQALQKPFPLTAQDFDGDSTLFDMVVSIYEQLKKLILGDHISNEMSAADFENLLETYYELLQKQRACLKKREELAEDEQTYQKNKDIDLQYEHWLYERNEKKLSQIEAALAASALLLTAHASDYLRSPEAERLSKQELAADVDSLQKQIIDLRKSSADAYEQLEKMRSDRSSLYQKSNSLFNVLNPFNLINPAQSSRVKLIAEARTYDRKIKDQKKTLQDTVKEQFIAEQLLADVIARNKATKAGEAVGAAIAGIAALRDLRSPQVPVEVPILDGMAVAHLQGVPILVEAATIIDAAFGIGVGAMVATLTDQWQRLQGRRVVFPTFDPEVAAPSHDTAHQKSEKNNHVEDSIPRQTKKSGGHQKKSQPSINTDTVIEGLMGLAALGKTASKAAEPAQMVLTGAGVGTAVGGTATTASTATSVGTGAAASATAGTVAPTAVAGAGTTGATVGGASAAAGGSLIGVGAVGATILIPAAAAIFEPSDAVAMQEAQEEIKRDVEKYAKIKAETNAEVAKIKGLEAYPEDSDLRKKYEIDNAKYLKNAPVPISDALREKFGDKSKCSSRNEETRYKAQIDAFLDAGYSKSDAKHLVQLNNEVARARAAYDARMAQQSAQAQIPAENVSKAEADIPVETGKKKPAIGAEETPVEAQPAPEVKPGEKEGEEGKAKGDEKTQKGEKALQELKGKAKPGRKTKGRTEQWIVEGGEEKTAKEEAVEEAEKLGAEDLTERPDGKIIGNLPNGDTIIIREESSFGKSAGVKDVTLEIQHAGTENKTKFRFIP